MRARPPPRLFYGWVLVAVFSVTETLSYGILYYAFTVFIGPMQRDLGWSVAAITGAFSLANLISGIVAPLFGRLFDRHGTRGAMSVGSLLAALLLLAWAAVDSLVGFYLIWAGLGVAMAATLYEPAFAALAVWFNRRRALALTVLTFIAGFASVIFIPFAAFLVETVGWRRALAVLALVLVVGTVPLHALLLRRRPEDLGLLSDGAHPSLLTSKPPPQPLQAPLTTEQVFASPGFWWLTLAFSLSAFVITALAVHLLPYLLDRGLGAGFAARAAALVGVMALPGRLIFTPLGSVWPRHRVIAAIFGLQTLGVLALLLPETVLPGTLGVWLFVGLYGAGFGAITPARAALIAESYGGCHYGRISGRLGLANALARALAPVGVGALYTLLGSYQLPMLGLALLSGLAAGAVLLAQPPTPLSRALKAAP